MTKFFLVKYSEGVYWTNPEHVETVHPKPDDGLLEVRTAGGNVLHFAGNVADFWGVFKHRSTDVFELDTSKESDWNYDRWTGREP